MNFKKITIIRLGGSDKVLIHTDMKEACYPYEDNLCLSFEAAHGYAEEYCRNNFPDIPIEVITK